MSDQEGTPDAALTTEQVHDEAARIAEADLTEEATLEPSVLEKEGAVPPEPASPDDAVNHPELVMDRDKAEYMAHASKAAEEKVVEYKKVATSAAAKAAEHMGSGDRTENDRGKIDSLARSDIAIYTDQAQKNRALADRQAGLVGDTYDKVKEIK